MYLHFFIRGNFDNIQWQIRAMKILSYILSKVTSFVMRVKYFSGIIEFCKAYSTPKTCQRLYVFEHFFSKNI